MGVSDRVGRARWLDLGADQDPHPRAHLENLGEGVLVRLVVPEVNREAGVRGTQVELVQQVRHRVTLVPSHLVWRGEVRLGEVRRGEVVVVRRRERSYFILVV